VDPAKAGQAVVDETRLRPASASNAGETVALATILTMVKKLDQS